MEGGVYRCPECGDLPAARAICPVCHATGYVCDAKVPEAANQVRVDPLRSTDPRAFAFDGMLDGAWPWPHSDDMIVQLARACLILAAATSVASRGDTSAAPAACSAVGFSREWLLSLARG